ncbi:hypothetical protein AFLA_000782 [Aspergillus flavus NRRL3357]|nr:hypothetical protein AFLA_000782 [Aspergillus flavus NRRL3357]
MVAFVVQLKVVGAAGLCVVIAMGWWTRTRKNNVSKDVVAPATLLRFRIFLPTQQKKGSQTESQKLGTACIS